MAWSLGLLGASVPAPAAAGSYDLLATEILTSSQASVTFSSLGDYAADYQHLQIRGVVRGSTNTYLAMQFNDSASGGHYAAHQLYGNGSSVISAAQTGRGEAVVGKMGTTANVFSPFVIDILDFSSSIKHQTVMSFASGETSEIHLDSNLWNYSTNAVTKIKLFSSGTLQVGSRFSIYGLKKASA